MPLIRIPRGWEIPERQVTPEHLFVNRRKFLREMGLTGLGLIAGPAMVEGTEKSDLYPAKRNPAYTLDRSLTDEKVAARYNNFYEFSTDKIGRASCRERV